MVRRGGRAVPPTPPHTGFFGTSRRASHRFLPPSVSAGTTGRTVTTGPAGGWGPEGSTSPDEPSFPSVVGWSAAATAPWNRGTAPHRAETATRGSLVAMTPAPFTADPASSAWMIAALAGLATTATAVRAARATRGSTAVAAALWGTAAGLSLALDTAARASGLVAQPAAAASLRMVTAALSLCPAMSLLGAKRPQHAVWQLIVASLALILLLPALASTLARPDSVPDMHLLGRCFLVILSLVGWMNFVATDHGVAATLVTLGQLVIVRGFLPFVDSEPAFPPLSSPPATAGAVLDAVGACLAAAGGLAAMLRRRRPRAPRAAEGTFAASVAPAFLGFRETLGAAWTLRLAERFDVIAADRGWPCRLHFDGIHPADAPSDGPWQHDARRALAALLRRFVSPEWLDRHGWPTTAASRLAPDERGG